MKHWTIRVGMTAAAVCAGLQIGCSTVGETDYTERKSVVTMTQAGESGLVFPRGEGWTEAGQQEVKDVTCGQRLVFDLGEDVVTAVRIKVRGQVVGGSALLQVLCSPNKTPFPATVLKGHVEAVIKQCHGSRRLSLDYTPEGITSGKLTIRVWHRATEWTEK